MERVHDEYLKMVKVTKRDRKGIQRFKVLLEENAKKNYPYDRSDDLALCFAYLRDYLFGRYYSDEDRAEDGAEDGAANTKKQLKKISSHLSFNDILEEFYSYYSDPPFNNLQIDTPFTSTSNIKSYKSSYTLLHDDYIHNRYEKNVRIIAMHELDIHDFNKTYGLNVVLLGLHNKDNIGYHDAMWMTNSFLFIHDGAHAKRKSEALALYAPHEETVLDFIHKKIIEYYKSTKEKLSVYEQKLFEYMLFEATHENNELLLNDGTYTNTSIINALKYSFGLTDMKPSYVSASSYRKYWSNPEKADLAEFEKIIGTQDKVLPVFSKFADEIRAKLTELRIPGLSIQIIER